jgi:hypothetical protein
VKGRNGVAFFVGEWSLGPFALIALTWNSYVEPFFKKYIMRDVVIEF